MARLRDTSLFNDASLVAYYEVDSGALTTDSKGANTLTNNGSVAGDTSGQKYGTGAADFGTANSTKSLSRAANLGLDLTSNNSWSFWVKVQAEPGANVTYDICEHQTTNVADRYMSLQYRDSAGTKQLGIDASGTFVTSNQTLGTILWHHIVVTFAAGGTVLVYLDGVQVISTTRNTTTAGGNQIYLASNAGATTRFASIELDDTAVFTKVLILAEVTTLFSPTTSWLGKYT